MDASVGGELRCVQLKKRIRNLQHQDMGVVVFMANEDAFAGATHAMLLIVFFEPL